MAYCPDCTATYADDDYACPDCRVPLAAGVRAPRPRPIGLVELYRCWSRLDADRLADLLERRGIPARVRSLGIAGYPLTLPAFAEQRLAVDGDLVDAARRVILQAVADGYVSSDGAWMAR